jgi:hypothetical protein
MQYIGKGQTVHTLLFTDFLGAFRTKGGSILLFSLQQRSFAFLLNFLGTFFKPASLQTNIGQPTTKPHMGLHHILSFAKMFKKIKCTTPPP